MVYARFDCLDRHSKHDPAGDRSCAAAPSHPSSPSSAARSRVSFWSAVNAGSFSSTGLISSIVTGHYVLGALLLPRIAWAIGRFGPRVVFLSGLAVTAVALLLYIAIITFGYAVASSVVAEKSSRVVEVVLSTIRPGQLLAGKVLGVGLLVSIWRTGRR